MPLRAYRDKDFKPLARLGSLSFGESVGDWEEFFDPRKNPLLDPAQVHVMEEDGEVRASVTVLPMEAYVDGMPRPMGGVSAVMVHPAYRRRGYAGVLMRAALRDMRERGVALSLLWPFAHAFYRAFGYELVAENIEYELKPTDLPTSPEQKRLREFREEDLPRLGRLLESEAARHPVCVRRSEGRWRKLLGFGKASPDARGDKAVVYDRDGSVDGYLIYKMSDVREGKEPERVLDASELVARTPEARAALVSFMGALDPLTFGIEYSTSRGAPLHPHLKSSYVGARIEPSHMLRLIDVKGALGHLSRHADQPLVLEVSDDTIPENAGEYTIGDGKVSSGAKAGERVALDVRQLAQLYAGYLSGRQLRSYGLVEASSDSALALLEALFPPGDPWVFPQDDF